MVTIFNYKKKRKPTLKEIVLLVVVFIVVINIITLALDYMTL